MTKALIFLITFLFLTFFGLPAEEAAGSNVRVTVNGTQISFDVAPMIYSGRTLVPVRATAEALGATVIWRGDNSILISRGTYRVLLWPGKNYAFINGIEVSLDIPAKIVAGRTLVPLRFIGEALDTTVHWNSSTLTVEITSTAVTIPVEQPPVNLPSVDSVEVLSVQGQRLFIGMKSNELIAVLGEPARRELTLFGYSWWIYKIQDGLVFAGVSDNVVVAIYTDSPSWKVAGVSPGDSLSTLSGLHELRTNIPFRYLEADITIHLEPEVLAERPLVISKSQAVTFYLDTARNREISAVRIMNLQSFLATGGYSISWRTTSGRRLNFDAPVLAEDQKQIALRGQERIMLDLVNSFRIRNGQSMLLWHESLAQVSRDHSLDMLRNNFFSHNSPQTGSPADRVRRANIANRGVGENLVVGTPDSIEAHHGLLNSPGHRSNTLFPSYTHLGVGIVESYYTLKFLIQ